jgi:hypothetical protein
MTRASTVAVLLLAPLVGGTAQEYVSAKRKLQQIEEQKAVPGSTVRLTSGELNSYLEREAYRVEGVRAPRLALSRGRAEGWLVVDFLKLKQAKGERPNWLMSQLLEGEHPVYVRTRLESAAGQATVHVERVEINGVGIEGRPLDYLIRRYVRAYYPEAKVGEPFDLGYGIEQIDVAPEAVLVRIGGVQVARQP